METLTKTYYQPDSRRTDSGRYAPATYDHVITISEFENTEANVAEGDLAHGYAISDSRSGVAAARETMEQAIKTVAWIAESRGWVESKEEAERLSAEFARRRASEVVGKLRRLPHAGGHKLLGSSDNQLQRWILGYEEVPPEITARLDSIPAELRGEAEPPAFAAEWLARIRSSDGKIQPKTRVHAALLKIANRGW